MKKCSICGSVSSDDEHVCGVCGSSLIDKPSTSLEQARQIHDQSLPVERRTSKTRIVGVIIAGVSLLALSGLGFYLNSLVLILMLLPGLFIIIIGITSLGKPLTGWGRGLGSRVGAGPRYREAKEVEEEKRETESPERQTDASLSPYYRELCADGCTTVSGDWIAFRFPTVQHLIPRIFTTTSHSVLGDRNLGSGPLRSLSILGCAILYCDSCLNLPTDFI